MTFLRFVLILHLVLIGFAIQGLMYHTNVHAQIRSCVSLTFNSGMIIFWLTQRRYKI